MHHLDRLSLVVDTDQYSGNFEREFCAYMTGRLAENAWQKMYKAFARRFRQDFGLAEDTCILPFEDLFEQAVVEHDGFGYSSHCEIYPTPGRSNDGDGRHYTITEAEPFKHPAYESVRLFLSRLPTKEEFAALRDRALAFPAVLVSDMPGKSSVVEYPSLKILNVRVVRTTFVDEDIAVDGQ